MGKKLYLKKENRKLLGVCSGLGEYFDIDPVIFRLIWIILFLFVGVGLFLYIVAALVIPQETKTPCSDFEKHADYGANENPGEDNENPGEADSQKSKEDESVKKLYRVTEGKKIFGICKGFAEYLNMDPSIIRIIWIVTIFFYGFGILAYLIALLVIPKKQ